MPNPDTTSVATVDVSNIINQAPPTDPPASDPPPADPPVASNPPADPPAGDPPAPTDAPETLSLDLPPTKVEVAETGVEAFDTVGKLLADKGLASANDIMERFTETGEISLEDKAEMISALGESVASMAFTQMESAAETIIADAKADSAKSMDYANEKFNGTDSEKTWNEMKEYVRGEGSPFSEADLATMNTMLAAGGLQAELVIDKVHAAYNADPNQSVPGTLLEGDSAANGLTFEPISRADYTAAMGKAVREHGEDSPQVADLDRRRTQSMARGY